MPPHVAAPSLLSQRQRERQPHLERAQPNQSTRPSTHTPSRKSPVPPIPDPPSPAKPAPPPPISRPQSHPLRPLRAELPLAANGAPTHAYPSPKSPARHNVPNTAGPIRSTSNSKPKAKIHAQSALQCTGARIPHPLNSRPHFQCADKSGTRSARNN